MIRKDFRIMIVDVSHSQRLFIEKTFNRLGYFAVLGLSSLKEATSILSCAHIHFDLLLVNSLAVVEDEFASEKICIGRPLVKNAIFYGNFVPLFSEPSTYSDLFSNGVVSPYSIRMNTLDALMHKLDSGDEYHCPDFEYLELVG